MRKQWRHVIILVCLVLAVKPVSAQQADSAAEMLNRINQLRLSEGLPPYHRSSQLTSAAQRQADDMAQNQLSSATGSDGSTLGDRIAASGYSPWILASGAPVTMERFWIGTASVGDALAFFQETADPREVILGAKYREIGVGAATGSDGRSYYVLTVGSRPNVLPVFINDGAATATDTHIAIRLTNETVTPEGQGANIIGEVIEVRISSNPDFDGQEWQPWGELIPWTLPEGLGEHSVYVQLRDAAGRTVETTDSITLVSEETIIETPAPVVVTPAPTAVPNASENGATAPAQTPVPAGTAFVQPTSTVVSKPGEIEPTLFPTWTPLPTATVEIPQEKAPPPFVPLAVLQGVALILGLYLVLHRQHDPHDADSSSDRYS